MIFSICSSPAFWETGTTKNSVQLPWGAWNGHPIRPAGYEETLKDGRSFGWVGFLPPAANWWDFRVNFLCDVWSSNILLEIIAPEKKGRATLKETIAFQFQPSIFRCELSVRSVSLRAGNLRLCPKKVQMFHQVPIFLVPWSLWWKKQLEVLNVPSKWCFSPVKSVQWNVLKSVLIQRVFWRRRFESGWISFETVETCSSQMIGQSYSLEVGKHSTE